MFTVTELSSNTQRFFSLLMAAVIVAGSLAFGVFETQPKLHDGYSVTVTQLQ